jgi:hypothetical protein
MNYRFAALLGLLAASPLAAQEAQPGSGPGVIAPVAAAPMRSQ